MYILNMVLLDEEPPRIDCSKRVGNVACIHYWCACCINYTGRSRHVLSLYGDYNRINVMNKHTHTSSHIHTPTHTHTHTHARTHALTHARTHTHARTRIKKKKLVRVWRDALWVLMKKLTLGENWSMHKSTRTGMSNNITFQWL